MRGSSRHPKQCSSLRLSNSSPRPRASLSGVQPRLLALHDLGTLLHDLIFLGKDELNVAGVGHVGVDLCESIVSVRLYIKRAVVEESLHDREHGKFGDVAWAPGLLGCA